MHTQFKCEKEHALMASMKISYRIVSEGGVHTGGEKLLRPVKLISLHV
jgi:hypothetical protein